MREPLDALGAGSPYTEVGLVKAAQVGGSETAKTAIGHWVDNHADSVLLVLPDQKTAEEHIAERVIPMLEEPRLARWVTKRTHDLRKGQVTLAHTTIYIGWSGSPQSTASRAIRFAVYDETDKEGGSAKEAGTADLIRDRLLTYGPRSKLFILSTPTVRSGPIWQTWLNTADRRTYWVPCPECGEFQALKWEHVRWDRREEVDEEELLLIADQLLSGELEAWYECQGCHGRIEESQRLAAVRDGRWVSELGDDPRSSRVVFHISALYSPWVTLARTAAEFLRGKAAHDLRNFYNSFLGLPSEETMGTPEGTVLESRRSAPAFVVPRWATCVTAGADTQAKGGKAYWFYVVRAWGPNLRSRLIACGRALSTDDLVSKTIDAKFPVEGLGASMPAMVLCVDSGGAVELEDGGPDGSTTDLVYRLARNDPARIIPIKGHGGSQRPERLIRSSNVDYQTPGDYPTQVLLHTLDTEGLKDIIAKLIRAEDPVLWEESAAADEGYISHMTAEEKTRVKIGKSFKVRWVNNTRRRNDLWDASVYCLAAAKMLRAEERRETAPPKAKRRDGDMADQRRRPASHRRGRISERKSRRDGGWITRRDK